MIRSLFLTGLRNIMRDKSYSLINIFGLTLGFTCFLFLLLYILDELSYDKFHTNHKNIYRVVSNITEPDNEFTWAVAQVPFAEEVREKYEEVIDAVRFINTGRGLITYEDKRFYESGFMFADSSVFQMFDYTFINGDPTTSLIDPNTIVITESIALKYFGTVDCLDKSLQDSQGRDLKITAVIEDTPHNSHLQFDALLSRATLERLGTSWGSFGVFTYVQLQDGYDHLVFTEKLEEVLEEHVNPIFEDVGIVIKYELQPIASIHLHSKIQDEAEEGGDITYVYIFGIVALFMLIIACINYMNLATARASRRAKEVGIRKVMGSFKIQLVYQFIFESLLLSIFSIAVSFGLIYLLLPFFNELSNKELVFAGILEPEVILAALSVLFFAGVIGGSYPAFYLSKFKPTEVLKGTSVKGKGNVFVRKGLVVFQFFISVFMVISTLVVFDQLNFLRKKDLGWQRERVVRMTLTNQEIRGNYSALRNELLQYPDIVSVGTANTSPGNNVSKNLMDVENNDGELVNRGVDLYFADYDFMETLGMAIVEGRGFSRDFPADTAFSVLVNEAMVDRMAWDQPLGKRFVNQFNDSSITRQVVGVIKNYHQNSLYDPIEPLMVRYRPSNYFAYVKMETDDIPSTLSKVEQSWESINPGIPFSYDFMDEEFNSQYDADRQRGQIFTVFSIITIAIASLGILGLISYNTEQRKKEIGIRKVIGAETNSLVMLLSKEFVLLVSVSILLAMPAAYYFMDSWLTTFAYRIVLFEEIGTFIVAAFVALGICLATISFHTIRAANSNPVDSLRDQ